jgi:hypothetical protein
MGQPTSSWVEFALATAPTIAVLGFAFGSISFLVLALSLWFGADPQIRKSPLVDYFKLSLVVGMIFGGASFFYAAILGWPAVFALNLLSDRSPALGEWMREWMFSGLSPEDWVLAHFQFTFRLGGFALGVLVLLIVAYAAVRKWQGTQVGRNRVSEGFHRLGVVVGTSGGIIGALVGISGGLFGVLVGAVSMFLLAYGMVRLLGWIVAGFVSGPKHRDL